ncbi:MAG: hypothetical protein ACD_39C00095G0010 [uncultured bacterium]|nr:MAG: hypothetical protein ACD_39C00095G0010 [uncultured bacterium]
MRRTEYYDELKRHARLTREKYNIATPRVKKSHLRTIYRDLGIEIDYWPYRLRDIRGAYFHDDIGTTVMVVKSLPEDPMIFTLAHELKHHLFDQDQQAIYCSNTNVNQHIEIGAEIFAAEFIYPENEFVDDLAAKGITRGKCMPETIVRLKHETGTTLSHTGLAKRAMFLGLAPDGSLKDVRWKKLQEEIFGIPLYKTLWRKRKNR